MIWPENRTECAILIYSAECTPRLYNDSNQKTYLEMKGLWPEFMSSDFFCSGIQSYVLLGPYLCFISILLLDVYVLVDEASIN